MTEHGLGQPPRIDARFVIAYALLAPIMLAPLLATRFLPALDLPHHVALADALARAGSPDSPYAATYDVALRVTPFAAHFILLVALSSWMSLAVAAKVLVGLQVLALPLACARLLTACGRSPVPALLAFPLGYAMPVHYGLLAFVLAVPVLLWAFAEAADEHAWTARPGRQAALLAVVLVLLFFCHLEAWAVGAAAAALTVATHRIPLASRALGIAAAVPSLAALALHASTAASGDTKAIGQVGRAFLAATVQEWAERGPIGHLASRAKGLPVHLLRGFTDGADVRASYAFFAIVLVLVLVAWRVPRAENGRGGRRLGAAACPVLAAAAAYFVLPHHVVAYAHSIYPRFAVVLAATALLALPPRLSRAAGRTLDSLTVAIALAAALHAAVVFREYAAFGRELADFEAVLDAVPPGHSAGGLVFDPESRVMKVEGIFSGVPGYYVTAQPGPRTSTYLHYCQQPHLPCRLRRPDAPPALPHFTRTDALDPRRALEEIDLFLVRGGPPAEEIFGAEAPRVALAAQAGSWRAFLRR